MHSLMGEDMFGTKSCAAVAATALLSACAGLPSGASDEAPPLTSAATQAAPRLKDMRPMTAKDILAEWGTFGLDPKPRRKVRPAGIVRALATAQQDYSASIQEIMANATCTACEQKPYHRMVLQASSQHGVPPSLIHAVIRKESGYKPDAKSPRNARGLMQITPDTARFVGVDHGQKLFDPQTNINAGTAYLKYLMQTHDTFDEVLAAYNAGPGNVRKYNGVPPFRETQRYVSDVKRFYAATASSE
jgi:soluble lytic murein transglycosylase-like protein